MSAGLPLHQWSPPHRMTHSEAVCSLAAGLTFKSRQMVMDGPQRAILDDIFAEDEPGIPTCFEVVTISPRQNIKSAVKQVAAIADLVLFGVELHIWTAHLTKTATSAFRAMRAMIKSDPDTQAMFKWPPNEGKGQEVLETLDGRQIVFYSRSKGGGRGETADKITVDEALFAGPSDIGAVIPTLMTIPAAQVRYASSGGLATSDYLRDLRDRGRVGDDPRLAYHEYGAPRKACRQKGCDHRDINDPGCALNDRSLWFRANVAHPARISEVRLLDVRKALPPDEFMREVLCWWEEPLVARRLLDRVRWDLARVPSDAPASRLDGPIALAVEAAPDGKSAAVGLCGKREDGRPQGELIAYGRGTEWVPEFVCGVVERRKPCVVMLDKDGPAGMLLTPLQNAGVSTEPVTLGELKRAHAELKADIEEVPDDKDPAAWPPRFVHTGSAPLDEAARCVRRRQFRDVWIFDAESDTGDPTPIRAVALARFGLLKHGDQGQPPNIW